MCESLAALWRPITGFGDPVIIEAGVSKFGDLCPLYLEGAQKIGNLLEEIRRLVRRKNNRSYFSVVAVQVSKNAFNRKKLISQLGW
ncbi:hypothetical protein HNQ57_003579 [Zhongshania antarctica]|uniref:Uncharacterized protein n=1 Tax=Zhongshania antarctica TaxID=641702 RepID=A0A840R9Z1_9GAMM|nr:hypothetical protein [Zhongshania antarctica]MBB5189276.1 hypothetical protein [Zhongshania antarctica]